jgi:hypothetical protein
MLLGRPRLKDAKVAHDWDNNMIIIRGNGIVRTIAITKHLGSCVKQLEVLLCYDFWNGITNEEEDVIFEFKPKLLSIGTISYL